MPKNDDKAKAAQHVKRGLEAVKDMGKALRVPEPGKDQNKK